MTVKENEDRLNRLEWQLNDEVRLINIRISKVNKYIGKLKDLFRRRIRQDGE